LTEKQIEDLEFQSIIKLTFSSETNEDPSIISVIRKFIKVPLDQGWIKQVDQNGQVMYTFIHENYSIYDHPHIQRLNKAIYELRVKISKRLEQPV
jgi:hypothetical protein